MGIAHRIGLGIEGRNIHQMQQQTGALQMAQEAMAQTCAVGRSFDEPGNVGNDETALMIHPHHTQVGMQGREGIICHLGTGG